MSKDTGFSISSAERYSLALFELSEENNLLSQIEEQSLSVLNLINQSKDFFNLIKDPTTSQEDLSKVINEIAASNKFDNLFKNFLNFLIQKRRFFFIERILKSFIEICSKKRGELIAELKSAKKLSSDEIKKKVFSFSLSFVFGFSTVFVILGASATLLSSLVYEYLDFLRILGGIIIIIFGIHFMQIVQIPFLNREMRYQIESYRPGIFGSYVIGLSFAFGWTPCIGPILGSILAIASTEESINKGILLLSFYSLGLALPFILSGYLIQRFMIFSKIY